MYQGDASLLATSLTSSRVVSSLTLGRRGGSVAAGRHKGRGDGGVGGQGEPVDLCMSQVDIVGSFNSVFTHSTRE